MIRSAKKILNKTYGYENFRPLQQEVIQNVLDKKDTLVILPTGGGKSICFQIPALIFDGLTLVISPLIALMEDQVNQLKENGVGAVCLNSSLSSQEYMENIDLILQGKIKLLYLAPETLLQKRTLNILNKLEISSIAIDEAHCVSEWGHDFRPEYREVARIKNLFKDAVTIALTATATPMVQEEISTLFKIDKKDIFLGSFQRENLFLDVKIKKNPRSQVLEFIAKFKNQSGIIYATTRKDCEALTTFLVSKGYSAKPYHAGLSDEVRKKNQDLFIRDEVDIMVATIAFGMGIDKPDIRFVLQYDLPKNPESYYQQIGRAGRDGLPSSCLLLFGYSDIHTIKFFIEQKSEELQRIETLKLKAMVDYASSEECLRKYLLKYFGEKYPHDNCKMCINCVSEKAPQRDVTIEAQKFLSCIKRTGEIFGAGYIADVLRGSKMKKILDLEHDKLSTWGIGKDISADEWKTLASAFIQKELIERDMKYGSLHLTKKAWQVFKGELKVFVKEYKQEPEENIVENTTQDTDKKLFDILRKKRKEIADEMNLPPYTIFPNKTLIEMGYYYPVSRQSLLNIHGVGEVKLEKYGDIFIETIKEYCIENRIDFKKESVPVEPIHSSQKTREKKHISVGRMFKKGENIDAMAAHFNVKPDTIIAHLTKYMMEGYSLRKTDELIYHCGVSPDVTENVLQMFKKHGHELLKPVYEAFDDKISYETLKILRLHYLINHL